MPSVARLKRGSAPAGYARLGSKSGNDTIASSSPFAVSSTIPAAPAARCSVIALRSSFLSTCWTRISMLRESEPLPSRSLASNCRSIPASPFPSGSENPTTCAASLPIG